MTIELAQATDSTRELREWTTQALTKIFKKGYKYKKVGVILQGLAPETAETNRLYGAAAYEKDRRLMTAMDALNAKFGREAIRFGALPKARNWQMKAEMKSNRYTTCLDEVLEIF